MKSTIKIGAITGIISSVFLFGCFTLADWLNTKNGWGMQVSNIRGVTGLLGIPIQFIGIFIAMQNAKAATGSLSYGQALKTGVIVAITVAIIVSIFSFLYCTFNPGYAAYMVQDAQKTMRAAHESAQQITADSAQIADSYSTGAQIMMALVGQFVTGAIMSLILGIFLKGKK